MGNEGSRRLTQFALLLVATHLCASAAEGPRCPTYEHLYQQHRVPRGVFALNYADAIDTVLAPTTVADSAEEAMVFHSSTGRACVLDVFPLLFRTLTSRTVAVHRDWEQRLANATESIQELFDRGVIFALHLGERVLWRNVSQLDYSVVALRVKTLFPDIVLYATEALELLATGRNANGYHTPMDAVPFSVDIITVNVDRPDQYRPEWSRGESTSVEWRRWVYESYVYPKLHPHQRVAPSLAPSNGSVGSPTKWDEVFDAFMLWSSVDPRVAGAVHLPNPEKLVGDQAAPSYEAYLAGLVDRPLDRPEYEHSSSS